MFIFFKGVEGYIAMKKLQVTNGRLAATGRCVFMAIALALVVRVFSQEEPPVVQNAVLEGIQFSSEEGKEPGEKVVTCYFIFKDKPTSYFYEIKKKLKKLIFEFNDTQKGTSPVPSLSEPPIEGFAIEQKKIDVNKEVKGLTQEWHDLISVAFDLRKLPQIDVKDEYNIISFSYKWTTDPLKEKNYEIKGEGKNKIVVWGSVGGLGLLSGGILAYYKWGRGQPHNQVEGPIDVSDLPSHPNP